MFAVNFFGFGTNTDFAEISNETVAVVNVESVSKELVSSGSGDVLLFVVLLISIFFAYFTKRFV